MLLNDTHSWATLRDAVRAMAREHPGRRFRFVSHLRDDNHAGDALVAVGCWQFFDDAEVQPVSSTLRGIRSGDAVVYRGDGHWLPEDDACTRFLQACLDADVAAALVMPQTLHGHDDMLARLDARFTIVCRDTMSLERARAASTGARLLLAPDLALYVDTRRLFERCGERSVLSFAFRLAEAGRLLPYLRWRWTLARREVPRDGRLDVIRRDTATSVANDESWDITGLYRSRYASRDESELVARDLLEYFGRVKSVRTNRLHAGVAGALMNCDVTFVEQACGRIGTVYHAWMQHLPSVKLETLGA